ncbi:MAG: alpha/beta fold hydrolase [Firmicutes bacterium]|nr:alpha/beta fold hydrolase [Bacillota bacterium]
MRKVLALGLAAVLLAGLAGTGQAGVAGLAGAPTAGTDSAAPASKNIILARVPLILVHGLGGNGEAFEAPLGLGLEQRLLEAGYRKGESLFVLDYGEDSNGDYAHVARDHLAPLVEQVRSATGTDRVDLLGYSMGGLVVRYFLNLPGQAAPVRTAVLLASPAHGSFAADIVKDAEVTAAYLRQAGAASTSQQRFVFGAARNVFEPSLRRFLVEAKLARRSRALLDFLAWLDRRQPGQRDLLFGQAQTPPGVAQVASSALPLPDLKAALTAAYLHALALNAARARLQKDLQGGGHRDCNP